MKFKKQSKYFETLKRYEKKFDIKESERYSMLKKRFKDDEDLDKLSMGFLDELYQKYHVNREKRNYDQLFKKPDPEENNS